MIYETMQAFSRESSGLELSTRASFLQQKIWKEIYRMLFWDQLLNPES